MKKGLLIILAIPALFIFAWFALWGMAAISMVIPQVRTVLDNSDYEALIEETEKTPEIIKADIVCSDVRIKVVSNDKAQRTETYALGDPYKPPAVITINSVEGYIENQKYFSRDLSFPTNPYDWSNESVIPSSVPLSLTVSSGYVLIPWSEISKDNPVNTVFIEYPSQTLAEENKEKVKQLADCYFANKETLNSALEFEIDAFASTYPGPEIRKQPEMETYSCRSGEGFSLDKIHGGLFKTDEMSGKLDIFGRLEWYGVYSPERHMEYNQSFAMEKVLACVDAEGKNLVSYIKDTYSYINWLEPYDRPPYRQ